MKFIQILSMLLIATLFASCNQGSVNDNIESARMWTVPDMGTVYIYQTTLTGSTSPEIDTFIILKTGQHLNGKTNVVVYVDNVVGHHDTDFFNYETNGDFSFGNTISPWTTYPTGSRQTINLVPPVDTLEIGEHIVQSIIRKFIGVENITTPVGELSTLHLRDTAVDIATALDSGGFSFNSSHQYDIWFAPSIGLYVKIMNNNLQNGQQEDAYVQELIEYTHQ